MNRKLQALFAAAVLVPPVVAFFLDGEGAALAASYLRSSLTTDYLTTRPFVIASLSLAVERVCYTIVWCYTESFTSFCLAVRGTWLNKGDDSPVDVIVKLFGINKLFQYGGFAFLYLATAPLPNIAAATTLFQWIVGIQLVAVGQLLNVAIYRAIGKTGVYYGCKFGKEIPWCTGFPFNVITAHPQYLGSVLTTYGAVLLLATADHVRGGWFGLAAVQTLMYAYMSYVEHNL